MCRLPVYEPVDGQELHASEILVAPGGTVITIPARDEQSACVVHIEDVTDDPEKLRTRTDATMASAAALYGRECIGVLLTGMGDDGRDGMRAIADAGGTTLAQDEESCIVFDLPSCRHRRWGRARGAAALEHRGTHNIDRQRGKQMQTLPRTRLGDMLVTAGALSDDQLEWALDRQKESYQRLGEILLEARTDQR